MKTIRATVINRAGTASTVRLEIRATLRVFPRKNLLATYVVRKSRPIINAISGVIPPTPNGHAIRPCNIYRMKKAQTPPTETMSEK